MQHPSLVLTALAHKAVVMNEHSASRTRHLVELSHRIQHGMVTYPGIPTPAITPYLTREESRTIYAAGTEFAIDRIELIGNTGTYLDSPHHRYTTGTDLADLPLDCFAELDAVVIRAVAGDRAIDVDALASVDVEKCAVLLHTGGDRLWGTPDYSLAAPFLTEAGARLLVDRGAALVGIDSVNIDDTDDPARPAHSLLLGAGIPIVEHLTSLDRVPASGARFTAAPPRIVGFGTFPVRAYASVP